MSLIHGWAEKLIILILTINLTRSGEIADIKNRTEIIHKGIHKRGLFYPVLLYPYNACSGILVAIAIPLTIPNRNVFLSYNFEANYNMPNQPSDSIPGMINRFPGLVTNAADNDPPREGLVDDIILRSFGDGRNDTNSTSNIYQKAIKDIIVFTRIGIYRVLESRLNA